MEKCYPGQHVGHKIEVTREFSSHGEEIFAIGEQGTVIEDDGDDGGCAAVRMDDGRETWVSGYDVKLIDLVS